MQQFLNKLEELKTNDIYPFHMPGHKRNGKFLNFPNPADIDITEIDGYDNLHSANGIILELEKKIAKKSVAIKSLISVNGSTGALLSAISSVCNKNDKIIVARNCHKSVYNACFLNELNPVFVEPNYNSFGFYTDINISALNDTITSNTDAKLLVITSPTYEGVVSDVKAVAEMCHKHNIILLVDEAHGAHFSYSNKFPKSATELGADLVCQSYHKTLPCFTQTAVLHICSNRVDESIVQKYMSIYQTSSPSYVLMASEETPLSLTGNDFSQFMQLLDLFYSNTKLKHLSFFCGGNAFDFDKSKIVIITSGTSITGVELGKILLEKYKIQLEMCSINYAIAMTSVCDTKAGFDRLSKALMEIDNSLCSSNKLIISKPSVIKLSKKISDAISKKDCLLKNSVGKISAEYVFAYPPGIPILVPGEIIDDNTVEYILMSMDLNVNVISESGKVQGTISIDNI